MDMLREEYKEAGMEKYTIGLDFGTLSVRAELVSMTDGREAASCIFPYPHAVMETVLPDGVTPLPDKFALQHPQDYIDGLIHTVRGVMRESGVLPEQVVGIGMDVTSASILPVFKDKTPLCLTEAFASEPHAWIKLWKHHAGEEEALEIDRKGRALHEPWVQMYGGKVSAEWATPKVLETLRKAPEVYETADYFLEVMDWLTWILTDSLSTSTSAAGYKALHHHAYGFPSEAFFKALDPRMEHFIRDKYDLPVLPPGGCAGLLTEKMAAVLGLRAGTPVSVPAIDAHCSMPGGGIDDPNEMMIVMGTSSCHLLLTEDTISVPGMQGVVKWGILPDYYGSEAGQSCVGDLFAWFMDHMVPAAYEAEAKEESISVHELLCRKLKGYRAGASGLIALDWMGGVRSPLMDFDLSGLILGLNLKTRPEDIYLCLIEATAFGTRAIIDSYENAGVPIRRIVLGGGIPRKNPFLVQVYADVLGRPIELAASDQACALGAAILGASAAGKEGSGYANVHEAIRALAGQARQTIQPDPAQTKRYDVLYDAYVELMDHFGRGGSDLMKRLLRLRREDQ